MNILALDLGTDTGYAYNLDSEFFCGTWSLATKKEITAWGKTRERRTNDPRVDRLCKKLSKLAGHDFDVVVFEDVEFASSVYQMQLWSALRSCVWLCAHAKHFDCVPVGTLKLFATGNGHATKESMKKYALGSWRAQAEFPDDPSGLNDDAIDAAWAWVWARHTFKRMKL